MKLVEIRWLDAFSRGDAGWQDHDEMPGGDDRLEISSVGWLLRSTKEYRVLLPNTHVERGGRGSGALAIPRRCILNMTELGPVDAPRKRRPKASRRLAEGANNK